MSSNDSDVEFRCHDPIGGQRLRVEFIGIFEGSPLLWQAHIYTLYEYHRLYCGAGRFGARSAAQLQSFIEVGDRLENGRVIEIGLPVKKIDEAVVRKTIIMVRNFKKLGRGRHEFGAALSLP